MSTFASLHARGMDGILGSPGLSSFETRLACLVDAYPGVNGSPTTQLMALTPPRCTMSSVGCHAPAGSTLNGSEYINTPTQPASSAALIFKAPSPSVPPYLTNAIAPSVTMP
ncbi:hypothetical protein Tdes44962_MAKER09828 [Teratosphaeria destructans]|uniref:Uncharacterized protein n=1 Tax=Teratosphaeria destructans TaxID=418781 RepID=A0A9W7SR15_9PEZI|nr:hypothetical protein Tdes44962_MAKER09828 [Teratosphaeria destructans]